MATSGNGGQGGNVRQPAPKPKVSAKVYRRRRQVVGVLVLLVVVAVVVGVIALVSFLGHRGTSAASSATSGATSSASAMVTPTAVTTPTAAVTAAPVPATTPSAVCDETGIQVSASVDKTTYAAGVDPKLSLRVTNTGKSACNVNVGTSQMEFKITSGAVTIFNSKDCQADSANLVKNLKPGASEIANFTWKRNRSAPGCAKVSVSPGAGTYVYQATLGKWSSKKIAFELR